MREDLLTRNQNEQEEPWKKEDYGKISKRNKE